MGDQQLRGPLSKLQISFDNSDGIIKAGERLTGHLQIACKETVVFRGIKLQFSGKAVWKEGESNVKGKGGNSERVYFNRDITLLERPPGRDPGDFPWKQGEQHSLPFECPIPNRCLTSYEGDDAFIRYFCRATIIQIVTEGKKTREVYFSIKAPFTVIAHPPDQIEKDLLQSASTSESVTVSGCCCAKGKVQGELRVSKGIFVPGESVYGSVKIDNKLSRHPIDKVECRLVERLNHGGKNKMGRVVADSKFNWTINAKDTVAKENTALITIPSIAPSIPVGSTIQINEPDKSLSADLPVSPSVGTLHRADQSPLFGLDYTLQVAAGTALLLQLPITVGHVPMSKEDATPAPTGHKPFVLGAQDIRESDDLTNTVGNLKFAPSYPVFEQQAAIKNGQ